MDHTQDSGNIRYIGISLIVFAIAFNLPYAWLSVTFNYPAILRSPPGKILEAYAAGGAPLIFAWAAFALCALLFAPIAMGVAAVTRRADRLPSLVSMLGIAAGVTQAIGLSRWVYAVPGLAASWSANAANSAARSSIETTFTALHQFAGVGIGEAIGQLLTAFWLIGVAVRQRKHPRFGGAISSAGLLAGIILLFGPVEGFATVIPFNPGIFGFASMLGFLILTVWLIWTGILCILRPAMNA